MRPKRNRSMRSNSRGRVLFKVLGAVAALVLIAYGFKERSEITSVQKRGKLATVEPISNYKQFKQSGSSTYTAEFHFKTEDRRDIVQKHSLPEEVLSAFKAGMPVQVIFLPNDPTTFVFASERPSWVLIGCGFVLLVAAVLFA